MQADQVGVCKFVNCRAGNTKENKAYYTFSVADEQNEVYHFYCEAQIYNKITGLTFGDELQLSFSIQQWRQGVNLRVNDVYVKKK